MGKRLRTVTQKPHKTQEFALLPKIINGGVAGIVGVTVVFPLDLVKTRLQNQQISDKGEPQYKNMFDCFKKTYAAEGYFGMYRGSAVNIILITPEKAIKLAANDFFRFHFTKSDGTLPLFRQMVAGGSAGACQIVITTPMELLKIQMQDAGRVAAIAKKEGKEVQRTTALQLTRKLISERGIFGLYRGIGATALRDVTFSCIYFPLFAIINEGGFRKPDNSIPFWWSFISGLASGSFSAVIVTPLDVMKTRLQTIQKASGERHFNGVFDAFTKIMKHEGPRAFFKGGLCRAIVIAPLFGIAQAVYFLGIAEAILRGLGLNY